MKSKKKSLNLYERGIEIMKTNWYIGNKDQGEVNLQDVLKVFYTELEENINQMTELYRAIQKIEGIEAEFCTETVGGEHGISFSITFDYDEVDYHESPTVWYDLERKVFVSNEISDSKTIEEVVKKIEEEKAVCLS